MMPAILQVYPNPIKGNTVTIYVGQLLVSPVHYTITDMAGRIVATGIIKQNAQTIYIGALAAGNYSLNLSIGQSVMLVKQ